MKWVSERRFLHFIGDIKKLFATKDEVPTKTSQLVNDSSFVTSGYIAGYIDEKLLSINDIKTIQADENGNYNLYIWDAESGVYYLPHGTNVYYIGSNNTKFTLANSDGFLIIVDFDNGTDLAKNWYVFYPISKYGRTIRCGYTFASAGALTDFYLANVMSTNGNYTITGELKFNKQPLMTAELAADDDSTKIPNTAWVNAVIADKLGDVQQALASVVSGGNLV